MTCDSVSCGALTADEVLAVGDMDRSESSKTSSRTEYEDEETYWPPYLADCSGASHPRDKNRREQIVDGRIRIGAVRVRYSVAVFVSGP